MTRRMIPSIATGFLVLLAGSSQSFQLLSSTSLPTTLEPGEPSTECLGELRFPTTSGESIADDWPGGDSLEHQQLAPVQLTQDGGFGRDPGRGFVDRCEVM